MLSDNKSSLIGIGLALVSALAWSLVGVGVKMLSGACSPLELGSTRFLFVCAVGYAILLVRGGESPLLVVLKRVGVLLAVRALFGAMVEAARMTAQQVLPLGDATAIFFTSPALVPLLAWLLLGEAVGVVTLVGVCMTLGGSVLVARFSCCLIGKLLYFVIFGLQSFPSVLYLMNHKL